MKNRQNRAMYTARSYNTCCVALSLDRVHNYENNVQYMKYFKIMFIEICKKKKVAICCSGNKDQFFFIWRRYSVLKFLLNSSFFFKQNVCVFCFTNKGFIKKCLGFYTQEGGLNKVALVQLQRNVLFQE